MKKQSFVKGALILMIANAVSKILGAVFKIPLTYILEEEGMAVYNTAFDVYVMFLSFIISGLPFGISKLVSEYNSQKRYNMINYTVKISNCILLLLGAAGTVILFVFADFFALAMKEERAVFAIRAISPSVFLVAAGTAYKSYFQGAANMTPTAVSQVIEAVIKLVCGYVLAKTFIVYGNAAASGGAVTGVSAGELVATVMLFFMYIAYSKRPKRKSSKEERNEIVNSLMSIAVPLLLTCVASSMLSVVDTSLVRGKLIEYTQNADEARWIFGAYTGYALTVLHLPTGILATLGVSILPVIAGNMAIGNMEKTKTAASAAIKIIILCALPCAVLVYFMSADILQVLFNNTTSAKMLSGASGCIVFLCVSQILISIMQSAGKIMTSFACAFTGAVIKIVLSVILIPHYGIYGAIFAANVGYFLTMLLNLYYTKKIIGLKYDVMQMLVKPIGAAALMGAVIYCAYPVLKTKIANEMVFCAVLGMWSIAVYALALLISGAVSVKEIRKSIEKQAI